MLVIPVTHTGVSLDYQRRPLKGSQAGRQWGPLFHVVCGCFPTTVAELSSCDRDTLANKAKNICSLALCEVLFEHRVLSALII